MTSRALFSIVMVLGFASPAFTHHFRYTADLTGPEEIPANNSPAVGHAVVTLDFDLATMRVAATFSGLEGTVTAAHIHAPTAEPFTGAADVATEVPTFSGFPSGVTAGSYDQTFDLAQASTYNPAFITASGGTISTAMNALILALDENMAYFNIHTSAYAGGEIRGFLSHVPGDYNDNGIVDGADYVLWRHTQDDTGEGLAADSNNDNVIDGDDYITWRENFGHDRHSSHHHDEDGSGTGNFAAAPEPTTAALLMTTLVVLLAMRRYR